MNEHGSENADDALGELFSRWLLLSRANESVAPEELCKHRPELLEPFREMLPTLVAMNSLFEEESGDKLHEFDGQITEYRSLTYYKEGGIGIVQIGDDPQLPRTVAVKRLKSRKRPDPNAREQFLAEANITALLEHPGVVPIYRVGADSVGNPYYAMRLLQGETLAEAIERYHQSNPTVRFPRTNPEFRRLLRSLIGVCDTIAFAHGRQIIHRDVKPENIMLGKFNETLVLDWGLAQRLAQDAPEAEGTAELTAPVNVCPPSPQNIKGSPAFMSPEQASGSQTVGKATDIYSLGATLYVLLTGKSPFDGASPWEIIAKVKSQALAPPKKIRRDVPDALAAICTKAMARAPQNRYQSAGAIREDLERWLADEPITAMKASVTEQISRAAKRHRSLVVGSVVALLLGAIGLSILALQQYRLASYERRLNTQLNSNYRRILQIVYEVMNDDSRETSIHQISIAALSDAREYF
jgi:eukaryotic-like serine/threonine-protein kinase